MQQEESNKFYKDLIDPELSSQYIYDEKYMKFAHWNGFAVGAICARLEPLEGTEKQFRLYIMICNVLAAYRRRGIASTLLKYILEEASKDEGDEGRADERSTARA